MLPLSPFCKTNRIYSKANTHIPFNGPFSGTSRVSRYQKGKSDLDFTEARDSEWQWHQLGHMQVCTSLQTDNHANTPPLSFLQAGCPSFRPTNSVKALKAKKILKYLHKANQNHINYYSCKCSVNIQMKIQLHYCATESNQNYGMSRASLICFNIISRHTA